MKTTKAQNPNNLYSPTEEFLTVSFFEKEEFREIDFKSLTYFSVKELCNQPFVFRFDTPLGRIYFAGTDEVYLKLKSEGKEVKWLHDLIESWRQNLIQLGLPKETSIYRWTLHDIHIHEVALRTFPGAEVEVLQ